LSDTVLSLPVGPELRNEALTYVCTSIGEFFASARAGALRSA